MNNIMIPTSTERPPQTFFSGSYTSSCTGSGPSAAPPGIRWLSERLGNSSCPQGGVQRRPSLHELEQQAPLGLRQHPTRGGWGILEHPDRGGNAILELDKGRN